MEIYKINNLKFRYPNSDFFALDIQSLNIHKGEFLTICGQSGCGKSTLLRMLKPSSNPSGEKKGEILFDGKDIALLDFREQTEKIGFVMQNPDNQIVTDKVWHELSFGLESLGKSTEEIRVRVSEMATFFGIEEWFYKKTSSLSGGQKQLLNLASVMLMEPSVLILDEPTSQLDPIAAQEFLGAVSKINREMGVTVILSEHRLEDALVLSDRVVVMDRGEIIFCGETKDAARVLEEKKHAMSDAMPTAMRSFAKLSGEGESPVSIREGRAWLNDYAKEKNLRPIITDTSKKEKREVIVSFDDVFFRYEKNLPDVIKSLNAKIYKGEFYSLLGGNGSGKTTLLSLISKINTPYRGNVKIHGETIKTGVLPQNPQTLFVEKTVEEDLKEMFYDKKISKEEKDKRIRECAELCEISSLLKRHPYDLSGGEAQRVALSKILLMEPDILLLDEPTKGMDAFFKKKLAKILFSLQKRGVTIIMVSHDIEFCCKYSEKCAMLFGGEIVTENTPREFFGGNSFYTTAANRMARGIIKDAVLTEDILYAFGIDEEIEEIEKSAFVETKREEETVTKKSVPFKKILISFLLAFVSLLIAFYSKEKFTDWRMYLSQAVSFFLLAFSVNLVSTQKEIEKRYILKEKRAKLSKHSLFSILVVILLIPLTILAGNYFLDDRKYYFISLLVIFEILIPLFLSFERKKAGARELIVISVLCALAVAGRMAFFMLPQFKPLLAIVIISAVTLGSETGFLVGAMAAFISNFFFGQGPWTPWQMFSYGIVGFLAGIIFCSGKMPRKRILLCMYGFVSVVILCGGILNISSLLMYMPNPNLEAIISTILLGLPLDILHGISTVFFLYTCAPAMIEKIERIKQKFGIYQ